MTASKRLPAASTLRLLEELPGAGDVVWATLTHFAGARGTQRLLFTAAQGRAGNTVLAAATAIGLAQHQRVPVCLIETDVRRPALAGYLGLQPAGLSDVLDGRVELDECLQESRDCPGLCVLPAGTARAPVAGEFATARWSAILAELDRRGQFVVLDAPSIVERVEARQLLRQAHAAVLVLRARSTLRSAAERAHDILLESGAPILGSIFNAHEPERCIGHDRSADRAFAAALRGERRRPVHEVLVPRAAPVAGASGHAPVSTNGNGLPHSTNGAHTLEAEAPAPNGAAPPPHESAAAHAREIDLLERRIAKLTQLLEQTEAELRRIAKLKNIDLGLASVHRGVQGLSAEEDALAFKRSLMREIFQANQELQRVIARQT